MTRVWAIRLVAGVVAAVCAVIFVPWDAGYVAFAPLRTTVQEEVDGATRHGLDGVIVYIDSKGKVPELYAGGWKDKRARIPADPHALFKIGSISKLYIAAAAAKLVADGRLKLDGALTEYLPLEARRIPNADRITLGMLLQHRSGVHDFISDRDFNWSHTDIDSAMRLVSGRKAEFAPGARQKYSNTNYLLIGRIIDRVLGYSHCEYIKAEIMVPLGLRRTFCTQAEAPFDEIASGYAIGYDGDMKSLDYSIPGGSMVATAHDVAVFMRALNEKTLLTASEQAVFTAVSPSEHTGLLPGYQSIARYDKASDTVVILFVSTSGGNAWLTSEALHHRIRSLVRRRRAAPCPHAAGCDAAR